jgi:hypothetical protein
VRKSAEGFQAVVTELPAEPNFDASELDLPCQRVQKLSRDIVSEPDRQSLQFLTGSQFTEPHIRHTLTIKLKAGVFQIR